MSGDRVLELVQIQGLPGFSDYNVPDSIAVIGRASDHFTRLRITVNLEHRPDAAPPLFQGEVEPLFGAPDSPVVWSASFDQASVTETLRCGWRLHVEIRAIQGSGVGDPDSVVTTTTPMHCKTSLFPPDFTPPGRFGDDDEEETEIDWPDWLDPPEIVCPALGRSFLIGLVSALVLLVTAAATLDVLTWIGGLAALAVATGLFATWTWWLPCVPGRCVVWSAICWGFTMAAMIGAPVALASGSVAALLLVLAYATIAGMSVTKLRYLRCRVPSAWTPLSQLPLS